MKAHRIALLIALGMTTAPLAALAADTTAVLDVHHADCALCGPIVKRTLAQVQGVKSVSVSQPDAMADVTATVVYDPAVTRVATLIKAVTNRGYPAVVKQAHPEKVQ